MKTQKIGHSKLSGVLRSVKRSVFLFVLFLLFSVLGFKNVFAVQNSLIISADVYNLEYSFFAPYYEPYIWFGMDNTVGGADYPGCDSVLEICYHAEDPGNKVGVYIWDEFVVSNFFFALYPVSNLDGSLQKWRLDVDSAAGVVKLYIDGVLQTPVYVQNNLSAMDFSGLLNYPGITHASNSGAVYGSLVYSLFGLDLSGIGVSVLYVLQFAMVIVIAITGIWIIKKAVKLAGWS